MMEKSQGRDDIAHAEVFPPSPHRGHNKSKVCLALQLQLEWSQSIGVRLRQIIKLVEAISWLAPQP